MGRKALSARDDWQPEASVAGLTAEKAFDIAIQKRIRMSTYLAGESKPKDLTGIYGRRSSGRPHGIKPDYVIRNLASGRALYVEIKRQKAEGNAHERACKYWSPGLLASLRTECRQPSDVIPFWWVFTDGIATDQNYRQEICHWFRGYEAHVLLWKDIRDHDVLVRHFDVHILPLLKSGP